MTLREIAKIAAKHHTLMAQRMLEAVVEAMAKDAGMPRAE